MSNVLTLLRRKYCEYNSNFKKSPILVESICYSYYYTQICKYFRFTNAGDLLLCYGVFDSNYIYIIGWDYEYLKKLSPKYIISKISLHYAENQSQFSFSLFQEVSITILQEKHHEAPFSFSIYVPQTNDMITCRTNIQSHTLHCIQNPSLCLFTLQGCCLILPSRSSIHCITFCHSDPLAISPAQVYQFSKTQAKRKLQQRPSEQTRLRFLEHKQEEWIDVEEMEDLVLSRNSVLVESIQSEVHQFSHMQTGYKLMNICVSFDRILSSLFQKSQIVHFSYCLQSSYLCDACCPLPHCLISFSVLSSYAHHSRSLYTIRHHLVTVEVSLHDETFYTKRRIFVKDCASFVVLQNYLQNEWVQPGAISLSEMKQQAERSLRNLEKQVKRNLCSNDFGRGFYYPSDTKFKYVVNPVDGDTVITL